MAHLNKLVVSWSGWLGGPGSNVFYTDAAVTPDGTSGIMVPLAAMYNNVKVYMPAGVTITFPTVGAIIDDSNGHEVGVWSGTAPGSITGLAGGSWSSAVGASVTWRTGTLFPSHVPGKGPRLGIGRTFLVPLTATFFQNDGTLDNTERASLQGAANAVLTAYPGILKVWHRPSKGGTDGMSASVTSATVPDRTAVLRSRRD